MTHDTTRHDTMQHASDKSGSWAERSLAVVVNELIDLAFPSKYPGGLTRIHHLRSVADWRDSNVADWRDDQRQVMSAIVRFGRILIIPSSKQRSDKLC